MIRIILASASAARAALLRDAGVVFAIEPAKVDEDGLKASLRSQRAPPRDMAAALARLKGLGVAQSRPDSIVIGADQILEFDGDVLSKPGGVSEAELQLKRLRGRYHRLISAAVLARGGRVVWRHVAEATLGMRNFSDAFVDSYLAHEGEDLLGCVGAYRLEGLGVQLFERIEGDYFSILGLPLIPLLAALREQGALST